MAKSKHKVPAITAAAKQAAQIAPYSPIGRAVAALRENGEKSRTPLANGSQRSLQAICEAGAFSALIKSGHTTVQIENDSFAVTTHD